MKIDWTEPALLDLENIRDYIRKDSEYYAVRFVEKIIEAIESLEKFPEMGRTVPEAEEKVFGSFYYITTVLFTVLKLTTF